MGDPVNPDGTGIIILPGDHTISGVAWAGCTVETGADGRPSLVATADDAWLRITLPPQHTAESPVRWSFWDNPVPAEGGRPMPPGGALTAGNALYMHGVAGVDDSGAVFLTRPLRQLTGRGFPPGARVAVARNQVFAVDTDGTLCTWRADHWVPLDQTPAARNFAPGAPIVAVHLPEDGAAVFAHRDGGLVCWVETTGWLPPAPFELDARAQFALIGEDMLGVVTVRDNRVYQLIPHLDGSGWDVLSSEPYTYANQLRDGSPVTSVSFPEIGTFTMVCDTTGYITAYEWHNPIWGSLWSGFPPSAAVTAIPNTSPESIALYWVFAVDAEGVLRAGYIAWQPGMGRGDSEPLGDWFPPGSPVAAVHWDEGQPSVFAVAADRTIRYAHFEGGRWSTVGNPPDWSPLMALPAQPAQHSGPSQLQIAVARGERVDLTAAGLRAVFDRSDLVSAVPMPDGTYAAFTVFEVPWGLWLSSPDTATRAVSAAPATAPDGTTAIWQARLTPTGTPAEDRAPVQLRTVWAREDTVFDPSLRHRPALDQYAREAIVQSTPTVNAHRMILSSAGGWLSAQATWAQGSWEQEIVAGRDIRVRVVREGVLLPFGHRATYVEVTERRFDPRGERSTAVLHTAGTLHVTTPVITFPEEPTARWRAFPFHRIELTPTTCSTLDPPAWEGEPGTLRFWPSIGGRRVEFTVVLGQAGHEVTVGVPLLFAETPDAAAMNAANATVARVDLGSSSVQLAGGNVFDVRALNLRSTATGGGVQPSITGAEVSLPALAALTGDTAARAVTFAEEYLQQGRQDLALAMAPLDLVFGSSDRSGGVATPSFVADGISALGGPVKAGALAAIDPHTFFGDLDAKLLGIIDLRNVIEQAAGPSPPAITSLATPELPAPRVSMRWDRVRLKPAGPFRPNGISELTLAIESIAGVPPELPRTRTSGQVTNFTLGLSGVLDASFGKVAFTANSGEKPSVAIDGFDLTFGGDLRFLDILVDAVAAVAQDPPVAITTEPGAVVVSKSVGLPDLSLGAGVFSVSLRDATFFTRLRLPFSGALSLDFSFGTRKQPFLVGVWILGGGGYLELEIRDGELTSVIAAIEIGGLWSFDWFVVAGEVHALVGIRLELRDGSVTLAGYLRVGGSVEVLGLISVGIEIAAEISASDSAQGWRVTASARLVIEVDLFLTSAEVTLDQEVVIYQEDPARDRALAAERPADWVALDDPALDWLTRAARDPRVPVDDIQEAWRAYAAAFGA